MAARTTISVPVVLTIAGSDSGGGAGIQADLKTFAARGVFGTSAITCLTAQNPDGVTGIHAAPPRFVALQIAAVFDAFPVAAAKTGMLYSSAIVRAVARVWRDLGSSAPPLIVDPVMLATSGARLLRTYALRALIEELLPLATVVTPNLPEAEALAAMTIRTPDDMAAAARRIHDRCGCACVVKGGHMKNSASVFDVLWDGVRLHQFRHPRLSAHETHGTGCTFSAALTASLALGQSLPRATASAQATVYAALRRARPAGSHWPLNFIAEPCENRMRQFRIESAGTLRRHGQDGDPLLRPRVKQIETERVKSGHPKAPGQAVRRQPQE